MTCIVAIVEGDHVYMGGDSCASDGSSYELRKDPKIFRLGDCIIGFTTSYRMGQILQYHVAPPLLDGVIHVHRYIVSDWIERVRAAFKSFGYDQGGQFLIGCRGELFRIDVDFQVAHFARPYVACGSGQMFAEGALHAVHRTAIMPNAKLFHGLMAAAEHCPDVRAPFIYESTEDP
jgi:ATP-dependent protease HslVU (ClpYQ) peptidase subunit